MEQFVDELQYRFIDRVPPAYAQKTLQVGASLGANKPFPTTGDFGHRVNPIFGAIEVRLEGY